MKRKLQNIVITINKVKASMAVHGIDRDVARAGETAKETEMGID